MISRVVSAFASWRLALVSVSALGVMAALALSAAPALACPNEKLREESNVDPATGQPYSVGLPDCRAYEMVSPPYKQSFSAKITDSGIPAAPDGETAGFQSEGDFGEPENYTAGAFSPAMKYTSGRGALGWNTSSTYAPANLVPLPTILAGLNGDFAPDLRSSQVSCGPTAPGKVRPEGFTGFACAVRPQGGSWAFSGIYPTINNLPTTSASGSYLGASADMSRVFIQPVTQPLLEEDKLGRCCSRGIYEMSGIGSVAQQLRLVNVDNTGSELAILTKEGRVVLGPLVGDEREVEPHVLGTAYHAISTSGETVFFTATPQTPEGKPEGNPEGNETLTIYARRACTSGPGCVGGRETVAVSNPSLNVSDPTLNVSKSPTSQWECKNCETASVPQSATFQGASADGSKVFFTTKQQLLNKDASLNLYEYDFNRPAGEKLVLLSGAPEPKTEPANVKGVLRTSSDGGVVYFVASGVLNVTPKPTPGKEKPTFLYAYDTNSGETKFVAEIGVALERFAGIGKSGKEESFDKGTRHAQTTPDGRYLVFSSAGGPEGGLSGNTSSFRTLSNAATANGSDVTLTFSTAIGSITTTQGSMTVTGPSGAFLALVPGMAVAGEGVESGTTISSVASAENKLTLSKAATATSTGLGVTLTFSTTVPHVTTTEGSTTVGVPSGGFPNVKIGMSVSGPGIAGGTKVSGQTQPEAVYRFDFKAGVLSWVSHAAPGCSGEGCGQGGNDAWVAAVNGTELGAEADIEDWNRAISGCPSGVSESEKQLCPKGKYDGEYIIFTTRERLHNSDVNKAVDVYEWHCSSPCPNPAGEGVVSLISDGHNTQGAGEGVGGTGERPTAAMSSSGSDVFFFSASPLVGQDQDGLVDVYDARVNGGFPKPVNPNPCTGEECQGSPSPPPSFGLAASSVFGAGGNLGPPRGGVVGVKQKQLTRAQKLAKALKACKGKPRKKRAACERAAKKAYGAKAKVKGKKARGRGK